MTAASHTRAQAAARQRKPIISGASGAGFVKQGDPIAVREIATNAAPLSPRKLCPQWGECPKTRTNLDAAAAAIRKILSFQSFLVVFGT
jgi:hypothetical protein